MAHLVFAAGTSHTPLLTFGAPLWEEYASRDLKNERLNLSDGSYVSYAELNTRVSGKYASEASLQEFEKRDTACQQALSKLSVELTKASPDVAVIVTDDESELFSRANTPAISVYYGETIITRPLSSKMIDLDHAPPYFVEMAKRYAMDRSHTFPACPKFAWDLLERLIAQHIDVGAAAQLENPDLSGFGHGIGFVIQRLFNGRSIPVIPILLNTYYPPNAPLPARCVEIGRALRRAIDQSAHNLRVALIASGGLSHFVVDECLDERVLRSLRTGDTEALRAIPATSLNSGSSEIRNWIVMAGALEGVRPDWLHYHPIRRTAAGTGIGAAFGAWSKIS
jgi:hypothetical protein